MGDSTGSIIAGTRRHGAHPPVIEDIHEGPPPTAWRDFKHAKLRQFPRRGSQIRWLEYLGHGEEGIVFQATISDGDPVALKIFWRTQRPRPITTRNGFRDIDWHFEDEARTAALLEKMEWAMACAEAEPDESIVISRGPQTRVDALDNLAAFSDEARRAPPPPTLRDAMPPPSFPPLPRCHGWTRIRRDELPALDPPVWKTVDDEYDWHWAIVYDFVPGAPQDLVVGQAHLDFFYAVGFNLADFKPDNWRGGRLVDMNDVCSVLTKGWRKKTVHREAEKWFWTLDYVLPDAVSHKIVRRRDDSFKTRLDRPNKRTSPVQSCISKLGGPSNMTKDS